MQIDQDEPELSLRRGDSDADATPEDLEGEFPGWHCWRGIAGLWYARLLSSSPAVVVRSADPTGLRDSIRREISRLNDW
jgi:hypothetical protein